MDDKSLHLDQCKRMKLPVLPKFQVETCTPVNWLYTLAGIICGWLQWRDSAISSQEQASNVQIPAKTSRHHLCPQCC